ncbi:hypothetical protein PoB_006207600 [Plakobranchus ocellatus]|uniref:Transmembrane protein n=1 Tax=Plakobranchus ocellatus TaxID=259542 RepID=A0AAV4CUN7_9GAST|nr:hypothetical protein PoB_006207600 [Plakobranchus ocellatus]
MGYQFEGHFVIFGVHLGLCGIGKFVCGCVYVYAWVCVVWFGFCIKPVHNEVISGFQALLQAKTSLAARTREQGDLRLSGPPSGKGAGGGARARDRRVPTDLRADSLVTVATDARTVHRDER